MNNDRISRINDPHTDSVKYRFSYCKNDRQLLTIYLRIMWQALIIKIMFHIHFCCLHCYVLHVKAPIRSDIFTDAIMNG